ncbi:hypothetical protein EON66_02880 [archaeon]|nr:MAG: hypothetical protein EON66_02880 [archaeon]
MNTLPAVLLCPRFLLLRGCSAMELSGSVVTPLAVGATCRPPTLYIQFRSSDAHTSSISHHRVGLSPSALAMVCLLLLLSSARAARRLTLLSCCLAPRRGLVRCRMWRPS